ncbi:MAG TPA: hypothetical protein VMG12_23935 [Polyangiaceae bacterium]|nr:hypothetical protein [Polyangiaceae bacterium]
MTRVQPAAAVVLAGLALLALAAPARAQQSAPQNKGRVVTISEVTIVGRIQKPIAAVDVSRIQPKLALAELRQPFLQRIEEAIYRAPF